MWEVHATLYALPVTNNKSISSNINKTKEVLFCSTDIHIYIYWNWNRNRNGIPVEISFMEINVG